jgi:hypothetical protein
MTVSSTPNENLSAQTPFSTGAEVIWTQTEANGEVITMIETKSVVSKPFFIRS